MRKLVLPLFVLISSALMAQVPGDFEASYPFDGDLADTSASSWDGTPSGNITYGTDRFGNPNSALSLDGSNFVQFGDLPIDQDFSISFWYFSTNKENGQSLMSKRSICNVSTFWDMKLNEETLSVEVRDASNQTNSVSTTQISDGKWMHVVYMNDANAKKSIFYINGAWDNEATNASITGGLANNGQFQIGNTVCTTPRINGMVDDVNIYTRLLDSDEVEELFLDKGFCPAITFELDTLHPQDLPINALVSELRSNFAEEFELVAGQGDDDNARFYIANGNELYLSTSFDLGKSTYKLRIQANFPCGTEAHEVTLTVADINYLSGNMIAAYNLDGSTDDEIGSNNATTEESITYGEDRFGETTSAAYFDGSNSHVAWTDMPLDDNFSISLWIKSERTDPTANQSILSKRPACGAGQFFDMRGLSASNVLGLEARDDDAAMSATSIEITNPNEWHHIVYIYNVAERTTTMYVDAHETTTRTWDAAAVTMANATPLGFATSPCIGVDGTQRFMGFADDIMLFDKPLTAFEVRSLYHIDGYCPIHPEPEISNNVVAGGIDAAQQVGVIDVVMGGSDWMLKPGVVDNEPFELDGNVLWLLEEVDENVQAQYDLELTRQTRCGIAMWDLSVYVETFEADTGLIAKYSFSNNAVDESGNGWDGTLNGTTFGTDRFDRTDKALYFNGSTDFATFGDMPIDDLSWTLSFWVNADILPASSQSVLSKREACSGGTFFDMRGLSSPSGTLGMEARNGNATFSATGGEVSAEEWVHIAIVVDDADAMTHLYINGEWESSRAWVSTPVQVANNAQFTIAGSPCVGSDGTVRFAGGVDEIRIYDYAVPAIGIVSLTHDMEDITTSGSEVAETPIAKVYPNPVKSILIIDMDNFERYELVDQVGNLIKVGSKTQVRLQGLNSGVYYIKAKGKAGIEVFKVLKE